MVSVLSMKLLHFTVCSSLPLDYIIFEGESQCVCVGVGGNITYDKIPVLLTLRLYTACIFMSFFPMLSLFLTTLCVSLSPTTPSSLIILSTASRIFCAEGFFPLSAKHLLEHAFSSSVSLASFSLPLCFRVVVIPATAEQHRGSIYN